MIKLVKEMLLAIKISILNLTQIFLYAFLFLLIVASVILVTYIMFYVMLYFKLWSIPIFCAILFACDVAVNFYYLRFKEPHSRG